MSARLLVRSCFLAALLAASRGPAAEVNGWPFLVRPDASGGRPETVECLGPLFFVTKGEQASLNGFRPLALHAEAGDLESTTFLYPLFTWQRQGDSLSFSFFQLINAKRRQDPGDGVVRNFDIWPVYFSRDTGRPDDSYQAFFPLGGTIKQRFGRDRIHFVLFPLYSRVEQGERRTVHAPWPFLRFTSGDGYHGFEFWPLFGQTGHDGDYARRYAVWPLFYKSETHLGAEQPDVKLGALPFYARDTGPGYISETYVWPFFGYTHRTEPYRYDEQRYLWPFLVQARGDARYVNRWAPLYTHSVVKGYDKTWFLWPLVRHATWEADGVAQEKNQFLFFVYWSLTQHSLANPAAAPARKTHLWPLFSSWDNGAGRRQVQLLSPLEVFFPGNDTIRQLYTPLFALYRFDRRGDADARHSLLWNAVTWRRQGAEREFHLGPLLSVESASDSRRIALGNGLVGLRRAADGRWRPFLFDFSRKKDNQPEPAPTP